MSDITPAVKSASNTKVPPHISANMSEQELSRFDGVKLSDLQQLSPEERADIAFQMDAREMAMAQRDIRSKKQELLGFYHSNRYHDCHGI